MKQDSVALRKRTQIAQASRTMFIWIAIASVLVGVSIVLSIFLVQKLMYKELVLAEKQTTVSTLDANLKAVGPLKDEVQALEANSALMSVKANPSDETLQVVLDALPSDANSLALGASLQNRLLADIPGKFSLESLQVTPVSGVESLDGSNTVDASEEGTPSANQISFSFSVKGDQTALRQVLKNLELSIRTIVVTRLSIETQSDGLTLAVEGHAFYQPARTIELTEKTVPHK